MRILLTLLLLNAALFSQAQTRSVLFIGNSYTYSNNLPQLLRNLALANGDTVTFDSNTPGGYTLDDHTQNGTTISKIYQQAWDYVVIQAQSQEGALSPTFVSWGLFPYAEILDSMVHDNNACTQTVFFMTWGRKNGDTMYCPYYPPVCTYDGMQQRLRENYLQMGYDNGAIVSPVGIAWKNVIATNPSFDLYTPDESHPSMHGSYLSACVFYSTLFRKPASGIPYYASLPQADAQLLQNIASSTVLDSMSVWNTEVYYPQASFTHNLLGGLTYEFSSGSTNADSVHWDFGDGMQAQGDSTVHTYLGFGLYNVTMTAYNDCFSDTMMLTLGVGPAGIRETGKDNFLVYPNPSSGIFTLEQAQAQKTIVRALGLRGEILFEKSSAEKRMLLDLSHLPAGVYFLQTQTGNGVSNQRIAISR